MTMRVKVELSDEEDRIVEGYRREHNKNNSEEAIKEIITIYKHLNEYWHKTRKLVIKVPNLV